MEHGATIFLCKKWPNATKVFAFTMDTESTFQIVHVFNLKKKTKHVCECTLPIKYFKTALTKEANVNVISPG